MEYYKDEELFVCHSLQLFHKLKGKKFWYLKREKFEDTDRYIWIFKRTPELLEVVTEYTQSRKQLHKSN